MWSDLISKIVLAISLMVTTVASADEHAHAKGPHGGDVKGFGKYHLEGQRQGNKASFYVLGDDGKTFSAVAKHDGGSVTVIAPGKAQDKVDIPVGVNFSETSVKVPAGKVTVLIILRDGSSSYSAKFNFLN